MTTTKQLDQLFWIWAEAVDNIGGIPDGSRLYLTHGSKTNGIAYRQHLTGDGTKPEKYNSAHFRPIVGDDFLGMTKTEAFDKIQAMLTVLWDMKRLARENRGKK